MNIADKLQYLLEAKIMLVDALNTKGLQLASTDDLKEIAKAIELLELGGSGGGESTDELFQFYLDFYNARQETSSPTFTFPRGVTSVGNAMFRDLTNVVRVVLTPDITTIQQRAFENSNVGHVEGGNIETIAPYAFNKATSLKTIDLSKVKTIRSSGMNGCTNFTNNDTNVLHLPEVTSLGTYALSGMKLKQIYLPKIVTLDTYSLGNMPNLEYVEIGSNIESINSHTFDNSKNIDIIKIDLPKNSIEIPENRWGAPTVTYFLWQGESFDDIVGSGLPCTYEVLPVEGASYGFELNDNGYYESTNKKKDSTVAICKVEFYANGKDRMYVDCINYGENTYDYGCLSKVDVPYSANSNVYDNETHHSFKESSSSLVQRVNYGRVAEGNHTIWIKYLKDSSGFRGNDTLQFKVVFG